MAGGVRELRRSRGSSPARLPAVACKRCSSCGLTVRGLTTAASIWVTAAIGILVGIGFWFAAVVGAAATLMVLALFRFIESRLPSEFYAHHMLRFSRDKVMAEMNTQEWAIGGFRGDACCECYLVM
jgi:MgtC family protein